MVGDNEVGFSEARRVVVGIPVTVKLVGGCVARKLVGCVKVGYPVNIGEDVVIVGAGEEGSAVDPTGEVVDKDGAPVAF